MDHYVAQSAKLTLTQDFNSLKMAGDASVIYALVKLRFQIITIVH